MHRVSRVLKKGASQETGKGLNEYRALGACGERGSKMKRLPLLLSIPLLAGCTTSQTDVLAPYTLANGQYMQDVVTIGTDKKGAAPIVTVVNTYDVTVPKRAELVSHDAASSPGLATVIAGGLAGSIPNAIATVGAAALHRPDKVRIVDCNTNQNQSQQGTSIGGTGGNGGDGGDASGGNGGLGGAANALAALAAENSNGDCRG